jgi:hypothetical protein
VKIGKSIAGRPSSWYEPTAKQQQRARKEQERAAKAQRKEQLAWLIDSVTSAANAAKRGADNGAPFESTTPPAPRGRGPVNAHEKAQIPHHYPFSTLRRIPPSRDFSNRLRRFHTTGETVLAHIGTPLDSSASPRPSYEVAL